MYDMRIAPFACRSTDSAPFRLPLACVQTDSGGCIPTNPLLVARHLMGAYGVTRIAPHFSMGSFPFLELFARGDFRRHSGELSGALRVRAVRSCPRPATDRCGWPKP